MKLKLNRSTIIDFVIITLGTAIAAGGVYFFLIPSSLTIGSVSAIAMVASYFIPLPISVITFILNVVLLLLGFLLIGKDFGAKTVYTSILVPAFLGVFEILFPNFQSITQDPFLDMICYDFIVSIGLAILFSHNASSGGLDIIAKILNKYLRIDLGTAMSLPGICVALSSALLFDTKIVVLSVLGTYFNGIVLDYFIFGMNVKRRVCIMSDKMEEIREFILNDLKSGATIYESLGAYDYTPKREILTIVNKQEYGKLMTFLAQTDPNAFVTVINVNEVNYRPKNLK